MVDFKEIAIELNKSLKKNIDELREIMTEIEKYIRTLEKIIVKLVKEEKLTEEELNIVKKLLNN